MSVDYERLYELANNKIFDDIFNYSDIVLKNNIHLSLLNNGKYVRCMLYSSLITVILPDTINDYYLYICENTVINNLLNSAKVWTNLEDILNSKKVNIDFVTSENKMIPKKLVHCILDDCNLTVFAINRKAFTKLNTTTDVYITINVDTDLVGDRSVVSHIPGYSDNLTNLITTFDNCDQTKCLCFINGYEIEASKFKTYGNLTSDYYELYIDGNIQFSFTVDLANRKTYNSSEENLYKDIIFIPKTLIHDNVCTYDTVSLIVRTYDGKGVFVPFLADKSVSQLTHACFSISSFIIDAALDKLDVTSGKLQIIVSNYSKTNTHIENGSLTKQLYSLTDNEISTIISGDLNNDVSYWLANNLEKRAYGKYLTEIEELDIYDQTLIKKQIECLGYYPFTQLLCRHNFDMTDLSSPIQNLSLLKPPFWVGVNLYVILHLDGNKIDHNTYNVTQDDTHVYVEFTTPVAVDFSYSVLNYQFILATEEKSKHVVVNNTDGIVINKQSGTLHVFHKTNNTALNIDGISYPTYSELQIENNNYYSVVEDDDQFIFTFKNAALTHDFIFQWDSTTAVNTHPHVDISDGKSLFFIPYVKNIGSVDNNPSLINNCFEFYLNGRFMIRGIDFCLNALMYNDEIAGYSCVLQNLKFLNDTGDNKVDIIINNHTILSDEIGYIVDGIIPRTVENEAWIEGISRLFINGKLVPFSSVIQKNTHFEIDSRYAGNGYLYYFVNSVSTDFYKAYQGYIDDNYFDGRSEVSNYFTKDYSYEYPDEIIITYGNKMFSSYLNEVINRILNNTLTVNHIHDDNDIINQLNTVNYLKNFDNLFKNPTLIDKRFIDIYPMYLAQVPTNDFNKYLYINRLVKIILGVDEITDHLTVYTG